jgi:hypothetical protein
MSDTPTPPSFDPTDVFAVYFARAADDAARTFGYAPVSDHLVAAWLGRIGIATRALVGTGFADGLVLPSEGGRGWFLVRDLASGKGPYAWFSRNRGSGVPSPNWEYFYQVAEYVRLASALAGRYEVGFEDELMDVSVRRDGELVAYVEVKETKAGTARLLSRLRSLGMTVPIDQPDRGDDPLRKAKYLVKHRPPNLSLVGGETRWHYAVTYPRPRSFSLLEVDEGPELLPPR